MPKYIGYTHTATALRVLSIVNLAFCIPSFISAGWESCLAGLTLSLNTSFSVVLLLVTASGCQIMVSVIKCAVVSFSSVIADMAFVSVILSDICGLWIAFSSSLAALLAYVILFLRSITGTAFVTWSGENAPVCDNDVSKSAYLNAGEGTDMFIYSKICK